MASISVAEKHEHPHCPLVGGWGEKLFTDSFPLCCQLGASDHLFLLLQLLPASSSYVCFWSRVTGLRSAPSYIHATLKKDQTPCFAVDSSEVVMMSVFDASLVQRRMGACLPSPWLPCLWLSNLPTLNWNSKRPHRTQAHLSAQIN